MRKLVIMSALLAVVAVVAGPAVAGGKGGSSIELVRMTVDGARVSGTAVFGEEVTFSVSTGRTLEPWVWNACYQGTNRVYSETHGFFPGYGYGQVFTLGPTNDWSGGPATCEAQLISLGNGQRYHVLASTSYSVTG